MAKVKKGKKGIYIIISEEIDKKLRELINMKYNGFEKGLLSAEVENALAHWIALHTQKHANPAVNSLNPKPKVKQVFDAIRERLKAKYGYYPQQVSFRDLEEAIELERGSDKRTIKKWIQLFLKYKLIKHIAGQVYEVV